MDFVLPELPYAADALAPVISEKTVHHHYGKHHAGYLTKLDDALTGAVRDLPLEEIVRQYHETDPKLFNLAAQVWNHTFYWQSLSPDEQQPNDPELKALVTSSFGSIDKLKASLHAVAMGQFGSGWAWLCFDQAANALVILSTSNAETPLTTDLKPLLTLDVWEHAYYLDHQQARDAYLTGCIDKLLNWEFAVANLRNVERTAA